MLSQCESKSKHRQKSEEAPRRFRDRRFLFAVTSSFFSKGASFAIQILAIPIAIKFCGIGTYSLYVSLLAASMTPCVLVLRLGPYYVRTISAYHHQHDFDAIGICFRKATFLCLGSFCVATIGLAAMFCVPNARHLFDGLDSGTENVLAYLGVLSVIGCAGFVTTSVEMTQAGFHENHLINSTTTIANVISCALLLTVFPMWPSLTTLILILNVIPFVARVANAALFLSRRPFLLSSKNDKSRHDITPSILPDAFKYTFVAGFCAYMSFYAPILFLATHCDQVGIARTFALSLQIIPQLLAVVNVFVVPSVPAIADALAAGDITSARKYYHGISRGLIYITPIAIGAATLGGGVFSASLGIDTLEGVTLFGSMACLFAVCALENFLFTFMLTAASKDLSYVYFAVGLKSVVVFISTLAIVAIGYELVAILMMSAISLGLTVAPLRKRVSSVFPA